jgi:hypothetical protein
MGIKCYDGTAWVEINYSALKLTDKGSVSSPLNLYTSNSVNSVYSNQLSTSRNISIKVSDTTSVTQPFNGTSDIVLDLSGKVEENTIKAEFTLLAASWSSADKTAKGYYTYDIANTDIKASSIIDIYPNISAITGTQLNAYQLANMYVGTVAKGTVQIRAYDTVPTIDIPILVLISAQTASEGESVTLGSTTHSLALKFNSGLTEDTDLYTFNGATTKTINIKPGNNISFTPEVNGITINSLSDENITVQNLGNLSANTTLDASLGKIIKATITAPLTFTFAIPISAGKVMILHLINGGAYTITWPTNMKWLGGTAPTLKSSGEDLIYIQTDNTGADWLATSMLGGGKSSESSGNTISTWDGSTGTLPTSIPEDATYISNASELAAFRDAVNAGTEITLGKTYKLTTDIDLNNIEWIPIGTEKINFKGIFDGQGHIINNINIIGNDTLMSLSSNSNTILAGFFGYANSSSIIRYLNINGKVSFISTTSTPTYIFGAGLCGASEGIVQNCTVSFKILKDDSLHSSSGTYIGGIVATSNNTTQIFNCLVNSNISIVDSSSSTAFIGGIAANNTRKIDSCSFIGEILISRGTNTSYVGGICSNIGYEGASITNCYAKLSYTGVYSGDYVSGIISNSPYYSTIIKNCCVYFNKIISTSSHFNATNSNSSNNSSNNYYYLNNNSISFGNSAGSTAVSSASDLPVSTILADHVKINTSPETVTVVAYPTESSQSSTINLTTTTGLSVAPTSLSNNTATALVTSGTGTITLGVTVPSGGYDCSATNTISVE